MGDVATCTVPSATVTFTEASVSPCTVTPTSGFHASLAAGVRNDRATAWSSSNP